MKLALMKKYYDTVDDNRKSPINDLLASRWFNTGFNATTLRASSNFVCVIDAGEKYYLRFNHEDERTPEYINAEVEYIRYLRGKGIKANKPVPSLKGRYIEAVTTELGVFYGVVFEAVPGDHIELDELDQAGFRSWGEALGELHNASAGYLGIRSSWRDQVVFIREVLPESETLILKELANVENKLSVLEVTDVNYGLIHYDFELDNIRWLDGVPGLMDFDDCVYHWYAADIIIAISELFDEKIDRIDIGDERFQAFLTGYRSRRSVNDEELANIPVFLLLDKLYKFARIYRSINDVPVDGEPQWTTRLREKLENYNRKTVNELNKLNT